VLERGFSGGQLRFFLIDAPYRDELDFTFEKLSDSSGRLESLRGMIKALQQTVQPSDKCMGDSYVGRITSEFEAHMNNNLDVAGAIKTLTQTVTEVYEKSGALPREEIENVLADLAQVDSVLQCLF